MTRRLRRSLPPLLALLALSALLPLGAAAPVVPPRDAEAARAAEAEAEAEAKETVRAFVRASNERDLEGLLGLAHGDVEWLSVAGTEIAVETRGRLDLAAALEAYYASCPTCSSSLEWIMPAGSRIATLERAGWEADGERRSQVSLAVYELEDGLIRRVYHHPPEAQPPVGEEEED
jgi:ketosteroid isomerase-like protein